jgi:hypothetical protein
MIESFHIPADASFPTSLLESIAANLKREQLWRLMPGFVTENLSRLEPGHWAVLENDIVTLEPFLGRAASLKAPILAIFSSIVTVIPNKPTDFPALMMPLAVQVTSIVIKFFALARQTPDLLANSFRDLPQIVLKLARIFGASTPVLTPCIDTFLAAARSNSDPVLVRNWTLFLPEVTRILVTSGKPSDVESILEDICSNSANINRRYLMPAILPFAEHAE